MLGKNALFVDRTVYDRKGKWKSPKSDRTTNIFYYISKPLTLTSSYNNGIEELKPVLEITIFGEQPIIDRDLITLDTGETKMVSTVTPIYAEVNSMVKDMLKPRVLHMIVELI